MPYAQHHYPFENKESFEANFPGDFIAEGLDQTRGWFYTLMVLGTALFGKSPYKNVIVNGLVLAEDGKKMSKRLKNYPDPGDIFEKYGADALRFYLMNSPVVKAQPLRFSEKGVEDVVRKILLPIWNSYSFFVTYANLDGWEADEKDTDIAPNSENKLDKWIVSELETLLKDLTDQMDHYDLQRATEPIVDFIESLTNWYIRRSRRRFWKEKDAADKDFSAHKTLYYCLVKLSKIIAPFMPFVAEEIYTNLTGNESVHLTDWPAFDEKRIDLELNAEMALVRKVVTLGHTLRARLRLKVRQPLAKIMVAIPEKFNASLLEDQRDVILSELNVKSLEILTDENGQAAQMVKVNVVVNPRVLGPKYGGAVQDIIKKVKSDEFELNYDGTVKVGDHMLQEGEFELNYCGKDGQEAESSDGVVVFLDTEITDELKEEGYVRDVVRQVQDLRKQADYQVDQQIEIIVNTDSEVLKKAIENFSEYLLGETVAHDLIFGEIKEFDAKNELELDEMPIKIAVLKK
jgi:isoleucyl-tRNA synthetase